jgi:RimJ/RimL family protein N-acetyltransferase
VGQGLGTDAMFALLDFGFGQLRLERMWLEVYDFNRRARRSYEKCGFVLEGTE